MSYRILDNRDIDLSYNSESKNAQSGKAVAEAVANMADSALNVKGSSTGTTIEINDISSIPHYIKCKIENKDWGKDLVAEPVSFNDYKTKISLVSLPRNYYYGINITFANGAVQ